jgi:hypothetical protein
MVRRGSFLSAFLLLCAASTATCLFGYQTPPPPPPPSDVWIDHTPPLTATSGTIQSTGHFSLGPNHSFIHVRVIVYGTDGDRPVNEFILPAPQIQLTGTTGTWKTSLPVPAGQHIVVGILQVQDQTTGQIRNTSTDYDMGFVAVP